MTEVLTANSPVFTLANMLHVSIAKQYFNHIKPPLFFIQSLLNTLYSSMLYSDSRSLFVEFSNASLTAIYL